MQLSTADRLCVVSFILSLSFGMIALADPVPPTCDVGCRNKLYHYLCPSGQVMVFTEADCFVCDKINSPFAAACTGTPIEGAECQDQKKNVTVKLYAKGKVICDICDTPPNTPPARTEAEQPTGDSEDFPDVPHLVCVVIAVPGGS